MANNYTAQTVSLAVQALANTVAYMMQSANAIYQANTDEVDEETPVTSFDEMVSDWAQHGIAAASYAVSTANPNPGIYSGHGAPSLVAGRGSLYMRKDGASANTRLYVNTTGANVWTAVVTVT